MMKSNLQFKSNVYLWDEKESKLSKGFLTKVYDAHTLNLIKKNPVTGQSISFPLEWQNKIANQGISCAYGKQIGDYHTHGTIIEDGKTVFVCKCQHINCEHYKKCSSYDDFREIKERPKELVEIKTNQPEEDLGEVEYYGDIKPPVIVKIPPSIESKEKIVHNNPDTYTRWIDEWGVRGHWRTLADGTQTWVRAHKRGAQGDVTNFTTNISEDTVPQKNDHARRLIVEKPYGEYSGVEFENCESSQDYVMRNLKKIDSPKEIITAGCEVKVFVNGAAGTGKTHTVIERLKYLINEVTIMADEILVLCFSRSAVKVIRDRLKEAVDNNSLDESATEIDIRTFDSFATWYLKESIENVNLQYSSYDERIKRFIRRFETNYEELTDNISYLIVDETQDLVGIRAEMVKTLLSKLECGFMLLGDQCQAIYDYQIIDESQLNAARFFKWLDEHFNSSLERYEMTKNHRQQTRLQTAILPLRDSMLTSGVGLQKKELSRIIDSYRIGVDMSADDILYCSSNKRAILSWSNGDAYKQSQDLFTRYDPIDHILQSNTRRMIIRKDIASILANCNSNIISKGVFFKTAEAKGLNQILIAELWEALQVLDDNQLGFIKLTNIRRQLLWESRDIKDVLFSPIEHEITVSTIHKAKGKEYDEVLVNLSGLKKEAKSTDSAEIKVYYVALTRAKNDITIKEIKPEYAEKSPNTGRILKIGSNSKVIRYELGLDGDIDPYGFVSKELFGSDNAVVANQSYIETHVKRGDALDIWLSGNVYKIYHMGKIIGRMNKEAFEAYKKYHSSGRYYTHYMTKYNRFDKIYVSDIITIVNQGIRKDIAEPYETSGFWLGVDFCGYSKPREE